MARLFDFCAPTHNCRADAQVRADALVRTRTGPSAVQRGPLGLCSRAPIQGIV